MSACTREKQSPTPAPANSQPANKNPRPPQRRRIFKVDYCLGFTDIVFFNAVSVANRLTQMKLGIAVSEPAQPRSANKSI
jgi:hypothetical protein